MREAIGVRAGWALYLGASARIDRTGGLAPFELPAHHLVTHAFVCGQTGSGKTGFNLVMVEEALLAGVPVLMIDVKGDLPNLLLCHPTFSPDALLPWVESAHHPGDPRSPAQLAAELAAQRKHGLAQWQIGEPELARYVDRVAPRVITPGSSAGELLHVLSSLERRSERWDHDLESARAALSAAGRCCCGCSGAIPIRPRARSTWCCPFWPSGGSWPARTPISRRCSKTWTTRPSARSARWSWRVPAAERAARAGGRAQHAAGLAQLCQLAPGRHAGRAGVADTQARRQDARGHRQRGAPGRRRARAERGRCKYPPPFVVKK